MEQVSKTLVANMHASTGSKHGKANAENIRFLQEKHTRVANHEKIVGAFGGQKPLFSEAQIEEIRRGRGSERG